MTAEPSRAAGRPKPITTPELLEDGVAHGFFTRAGGVSKGLYAGLNVGVGSGDDRGDVMENRRRAARALGSTGDDVTTPYQVHSADVHVAEAPFPHDIGEKPRCDAVVTAVPGLPIGVVTADCGPVLFADAEKAVVGAAHAGWKGAISGILEATVDSMAGLGANRASIVAVLGPTISQASYEVGPEFLERFEAGQRERFFVPSTRPNHAMFDLPAFILDRLARAGVRGAWTGHCTYADEAAFFSYRRMTHRGEADYGRQLSAIMLEA